MMQSSPQQTAQQSLMDRIGNLIKPMGYELVHAEVQTHKQRLLRLFIDHIDARSDANGQPDKTVKVEDCVKVTRAVDEPLDQDPELAETVNKIFGSAPYELEVSSPGVDRPLRQTKDFIRFTGREIRVHVFRPLSAKELANVEYQARNPKQRNFLGTLLGMENEDVRLKINPAGGLDAGNQAPKKKKKTTNASPTNTSEEAENDKGLIVSIPLPLISKSHLEPRFDFEE